MFFTGKISKKRASESEEEHKLPCMDMYLIGRCSAEYKE